MFSYTRDARTRARGAYTSRVFLGIYLGEQEARDEKEDGRSRKVDMCNVLQDARSGRAGASAHG